MELDVSLMYPNRDCKERLLVYNWMCDHELISRAGHINLEVTSFDTPILLWDFFVLISQLYIDQYVFSPYQKLDRERTLSSEWFA